jgi:hypothetical protein
METTCNKNGKQQNIETHYNIQVKVEQIFRKTSE